MKTADKKRVAVIGCTGSVGSSVLDVCRSYPENFQVTALAAETGRSTLPSLCREFQPERVILRQPREDLPDGVSLQTDAGALLRLVESDVADHFVFASSGVAAAKALARALELGREVSLANKESALILGDRLWPAVRRGLVRPLDSEHNALWQCLAGEHYDNVSRLTLTASGGPFLHWDPQRLKTVTPAQAAAHPVWAMGQKISVDSATMINKGIELLEAHYLFGIPGDRIDAVIHPGSRIHGIVSFHDGAAKLLMSPPDMRLAALTALSWPLRLPLRLEKLPGISLDGLDLHFERPSKDLYPGFYTAMDALSMGEPYPVILIAADEAAVRLFLQGQISFPRIAGIVADVAEGYRGPAVADTDGRILLYERCLEHACEYALGKTVKKEWA